MRILINASNIKKSGALQVCLSFLEEIKNIPEHYYIVVVSSEVASHINMDSYDPAKFQFYVVNLKVPLKAGHRLFIKTMNDIVTKSDADCVFSVFGPTYWMPKIPHLAGFAYPWIINADSKFIKSLSLSQKVKLMLENGFKRYFFKRDASFLVVETSDVKNRLHQFLDVELKKIFVVGNTANHHFLNMDDSKQSHKSQRDDKTDFKLITITSNFSHKNLAIINNVLASLQAKGVTDIYFLVTIPKEDHQQLFGSSTHVVNLGTIKPSECPHAYSKADAMFLPTLLECFSASYPEAMIMKKPILTSDLDFARDICADAAIYFNPFDPDNIADKIIELRHDIEMQNKLIEKGLTQVKKFPTPGKRAQQYIRICEAIVSNKIDAYAI